MALPKGKLMALLAVFAAIGIVTATGAFTSVSADRTATAEVVGDDSALLQLNPTSSYAQISGNTLTIDFDNAASGSGLNPNAVTTFEGLFTITNNGASETNVSVAIDASSAPTGTSVTLIQDGTDTGSTSFNVDNVAAGSQAASVGMKFDTGSTISSSSFTITIRIEADDTKGLQNTFTP